jgi:hypothetical protein
MPLEGLRAWIGEVERKLGMRTRVFLVLVVIAVGGAGAAIYLAIDARESSVSESDVQALQEKLETQIAEGGTAAPVVPEEEAPVEPAPEPPPEPETKPDKGAKNGAAEGGASAPSDTNSAKLKELAEQAEKQP